MEYRRRVEYRSREGSTGEGNTGERMNAGEEKEYTGEGNGVQEKRR